MTENVCGYISKDIIANFNFTLTLNTKLIAQKTGFFSEILNFTGYNSLFQENNYFQ